MALFSPSFAVGKTSDSSAFFHFVSGLDFSELVNAKTLPTRNPKMIRVVNKDIQLASGIYQTLTNQTLDQWAKSVQLKNKANNGSQWLFN